MTIRIGSVSYLNARPLVEGLDRDANLELHFEVPSKLLAGLIEKRFDVALLPVIDYQRHENLTMLTAGGIACDGPALTVRIFSRVPIEKITSLACDIESHTSVALARILLAETFNIHPEFVDLNASAIAADAQLLIGDKVINNPPIGYAHEIDLGQAWKELTDLPFVFAAWMVRDGVELNDLAQKLAAAKNLGRRNIDAIIQQHAVPRGWPASLAKEYLTKNLQFDITPAHVKAIERLHNLAAKHGLIDRAAPLRIISEV